MPRTSPVPPRVSAPDLPPVLEPHEPTRGSDLLAASLELAGTADLAHARVEQCVLRADAESVDLTGATLLDVELPDPRIASLRLRTSSIRRLRITGGRIGTLDLSEARVAELELRNVRIDYLNLGAARAEDVDVVRCTIRTLDLPRAELTRVRFQETRSDELDPRGLRAKDLDLRGLDALSYLDVQSLRGATLSPLQVQQLAAVMAAGLGILVTD